MRASPMRQEASAPAHAPAPEPDYMIDLPPLRNDVAKDVRCWICYLDYSESSAERWVRPCRCRGTIEYAHEACVLRFIESKNVVPPRCPHCLAEYHVYAPAGGLFRVLLGTELVYLRMVPYACIAGIGLSGIFVAAAHGAHTLFVLAGAETASRWLSDLHNGWRVWLTLPLIPAALCAARLHRLDSVLPLLPLWLAEVNALASVVAGAPSWPPSPLATVVLLPWFRHMYNGLRRLAIEHLLLPIALKSQTSTLASSASPQNEDTQRLQTSTAGMPATSAAHGGSGSSDAGTADSERQNVLDELVGASDSNRDIPRLVVGALVMPAVASSAGWVLGCSSRLSELLPSQFLRSIAGGCLFVFIKDAAQLYMRYRVLNIRREKRIASYVV